MKVPYFDYPLIFKSHEREHMDIIHSTLSRGAYIMGEDIERFEENLARFTGSRFAVGMGNCTDALLLALHAAGVGPGDEVVSVSHTFVATIEVIKFLGATPVFIDIAEDHNMDVDKLQAALTPRTKAIVPVQLNGRICTAMERLVDIAKGRGITVIEDAAQSLGATLNGRGGGTFGLAGCFSFYPAKLLGAFGDAGAAITDNEGFARALRRLRDHGRENTKTNVAGWGLNSRLDNLHAALLDFKLGLLPAALGERRAIARRYHDGLSNIEALRLPPPPVDGDRYDVFQNYEVEATRRDDLAAHLGRAGIGAIMPWGGKGVHQIEALDMGGANLPRTEKFFAQAIMLPIYPGLKDEQVEYIINSIRDFYRIEP